MFSVNDPASRSVEVLATWAESASLDDLKSVCLSLRKLVPGSPTVAIDRFKDPDDLVRDRIIAKVNGTFPVSVSFDVGSVMEIRSHHPRSAVDPPDWINAPQSAPTLELNYCTSDCDLGTQRDVLFRVDGDSFGVNFEVYSPCGYAADGEIKIPLRVIGRYLEEVCALPEYQPGSVSQAFSGSE